MRKKLLISIEQHLSDEGAIGLQPDLFELKPKECGVIPRV
jgi:hypothetical protein